MKEKNSVLENPNQQMTYKVQVPKGNFNYTPRMRPIYQIRRG
ncbi:hypothetical protein ADIS_0393 [Lunatimonas lonarensis]|uniref:Uncharacterized protein n=1 Tax=Lunatimonas lonarensis TaxID=1232681 RepID=R7ZYN3_9BACT|nr:hypothetical protein ADIS_0393 [Lunatimonas lonarensis]